MAIMVWMSTSNLISKKLAQKNEIALFHKLGHLDKLETVYGNLELLAPGLE